MDNNTLEVNPHAEVAKLKNIIKMLEKQNDNLVKSHSTPIKQCNTNNGTGGTVLINTPNTIHRQHSREGTSTQETYEQSMSHNHFIDQIDVVDLDSSISDDKTSWLWRSPNRKSLESPLSDEDSLSWLRQDVESPLVKSCRQSFSLLIDSLSPGSSLHLAPSRRMSAVVSQSSSKLSLLSRFDEADVDTSPVPSRHSDSRLGYGTASHSNSLRGVHSTGSRPIKTQHDVESSAKGSSDSLDSVDDAEAMARLQERNATRFKEGRVQCVKNAWDADSESHMDSSMEGPSDADGDISSSREEDSLRRSMPNLHASPQLQMRISPSADLVESHRGRSAKQEMKYMAPTSLPSNQYNSIYKGLTSQSASKETRNRSPAMRSSRHQGQLLSGRSPPRIATPRKMSTSGASPASVTRQNLNGSLSSRLSFPSNDGRRASSPGKTLQGRGLSRLGASYLGSQPSGLRAPSSLSRSSFGGH